MRSDGVSDLKWALPAALVILLMPPVLLLFDRPMLIGGIPLLHAYLFLVWLVFIGATAWLARRLFRDEESAKAPPWDGN
ncbi:hypothetical protein [Amorphus sp. 3PC139-8]|uniref:hypothetical protein n=1 Tax=Amorphus sp. 3PC139-8 TaxID=2735676 RepID=UPI00345DA1B2